MRERLFHLLLIACFAVLFYVNSFGNFFVWNDWTLIIENVLVRDWTNLPEIFTSAFWKPLIGEPSQVYRPLVSVSFMADFVQSLMRKFSIMRVQSFQTKKLPKLFT